MKTSADGTDIATSAEWVTEEVMGALDDAIAAAQAIVDAGTASQADFGDAIRTLNTAIGAFNAAKTPGTAAEEPTDPEDDTAPPTMASAAHTSDTMLTVTFSEALSAADYTKFTVTDKTTTGTTYAVSGATVGSSDNKTVELAVASVAVSSGSGLTVKIAADAVTDTAGNKSAANTTGVNIDIWKPTESEAEES